jgi:uncharacterized protein
MSETTTRDYIFLKQIIEGLTEHPEDIKITRVVDEMGVLLNLEVHPDDMKQVIGKMGNTVNAIRTLLRIVGVKMNARVNLKINEPGGGQNMGYEGRM